MSTEYDSSQYPELLREFANYKAVIQGCSVKTINEYMLDLRNFFRYLLSARRGRLALDNPEEDITGLDASFFTSVKTAEIYDYLFYCERKLKKAPAARARKLSAIKGFYKYLTVKRGIMQASPAETIEAPKKRQALPKYLTYEESLLLLSAAATDRETRPAEARLRNYTMITLFLNCGMRLSELTGINIGDVDRNLRSVRVIGKGNKERIIYMNSACREAMTEYLPMRMSPKYANVGTKALFLSSRNERISNRAVQWTVEKYLDKAGLGYRHLSVHKLRHTAATLMYRNGGVDVRVLKEILGHEQLNTTQIYTHVASGEIEASMEKNPLSEIRLDGIAPEFESLTGDGPLDFRDDVETSDGDSDDN
ncbi:MAG: tyrosine recombinase XerC [Clostridia bacterium]|nr:tyrosine recombinase XerC [Clostridia bacterium]